MDCLVILSQRCTFRNLPQHGWLAACHLVYMPDLLSKPITKAATEFASLPGEFATVGKLSLLRKGSLQNGLRQKKN